MERSFSRGFILGLCHCAGGVNVAEAHGRLRQAVAPTEQRRLLALSLLSLGLCAQYIGELFIKTLDMSLRSSNIWGCLGKRGSRCSALLLTLYRKLKLSGPQWVMALLRVSAGSSEAWLIEHPVPLSHSQH